MAYKKVVYNTGTDTWNVENLAGGGTTLTDADIVSGKLWDGNWLNWLSMRRIDVLRKVLMGGDGHGAHGRRQPGQLRRSPAADRPRFYKKSSTAPASARPYRPMMGNYSYLMPSGEITVNGTNYYIRVQKDIAHEPDDFLGTATWPACCRAWATKSAGATSGSTTARAANESGGTVEHTIGTNMTTLITDLQNTGCDTWTPLAESFYVAMQYFKQEDPAGGLDYPNSAVPNSNLRRRSLLQQQRRRKGVAAPRAS